MKWLSKYFLRVWTVGSHPDVTSGSGPIRYCLRLWTVALAGLPAIASATAGLVLVWGLTSGGWAADSTSSTRSGQASSQHADELRAQAVAVEKYAWMVKLAAEAGTEVDFNRAYLDFQPELIDGDVLLGFWPWLRVFKLGGRWENLGVGEDAPEWLARRTAFHLSPGESGALCLILDRDVLGDANLELQIEFYDDGAADFTKSAEMFVDLVDSNESVLASSVEYGNLLEGTGEVVVKAMDIPLADYPEARGIYLRGEGELFVLGGALFVNEGSWGMTGEEAVFDGRAQQPIAPFLGPPGGQAVRPYLPAGIQISPPAFQATRINAITIPQFVQALMSDGDFIITRDALDGGGTRQTSAAFIMEDSFAQSSAIGFSYGSLITLHAGYQQADDKQLEIWNVGAVPYQFNSELGEFTTLSYVLSSRSPGVTIEVTDNSTNIVLMSNVPLAPGLHTFVWDGKDESGNSLADDWIFRIRASDYQVQVITNEDAVVNIWNVKPVIVSVSDTPDPFCPTTDGTTTIFYTTVNKPQNRNLDVFIAIEDAYGNPVANFSVSNQSPGSYSFVWDGTGASRNGLYIYRITATNSANPIRSANEKTGSIILACNPECATSQDGNVQVCYQPGSFSIEISGASPGQVSEASRAVLTAEPGLLFQGGIYDIRADPSTSFDPPALMIFNYDPAIIGDIDGKLAIRSYDPSVTNWVMVSPQFVDYANHRIIAEVTNLSLHALFAGEEPAAPVVLNAMVRLEPETLNVNPGILTAFVSLPAGYPVVGITSATCDGALYERMMLNNDATEMIIKFRRQAIEAALAQIGESIDIYFVIRGVWQDDAGNSCVFQGADSITRIVGGK